MVQIIEHIHHCADWIITTVFMERPLEFLAKAFVHAKVSYPNILKLNWTNAYKYCIHFCCSLLRHTKNIFLSQNKFNEFAASHFPYVVNYLCLCNRPDFFKNILKMSSAFWWRCTLVCKQNAALSFVLWCISLNVSCLLHNI